MTRPDETPSFLSDLTPEQTKGALIALDQISRPLTAREIQETLQARGLGRNAAHRLGNMLRPLKIIAIIGEEK